MVQKFGMTWWGEQWLKALSNIDNSNRLPRGAAYARKGAVLKIDVSNNVVIAKVQGSRRTPYTVKISSPKFLQSQIDKLIEKILEHPLVLSQLLNRELNPMILEICESLNMQIFPDSWRYFAMQCSCPDFAVPCKHLAAVIYMFSREIDNNPFLIFSMHGIDFFEELKVRDITLTTSIEGKIPLYSSLIITDKVIKKSKKNADEELDIQYIDYSRLKNITEPMCSILDSNPPFFPRGNFKELYLDTLTRISRNAERLLLRKKTLLDFQNNAPELILKDDVLKININKDCKFALNVTTVDNDVDRVLPTMDNLMLSLLQLDVDYLDDYDVTVSSLYKIVIAAINLLAKGCVVPQLVLLEKDFYAIRWLPAILDDEVRIVADSLNKIVPQGILTTTLFDEENERLVKNSSEHLISYMLTSLVSSLSGSSALYESLVLLFFKNSPLKFEGIGEREIPGSLKVWLDKLFISSSQYKPSMLIKEGEKDTLLLELFIEYKGVEVPLSSVFSQKKYGKERFSILREISLLSSLVDGLDEYINDNAQNPILFDLKTFAPFLTKIIPAIRMLGIKVLLPKSLQNLIRPRPSMLLSKKATDGVSYLRIDQLLVFDWQVALGDELLSEKEFMQLMKKARGLIKFKNNYIYVQDSDLERLQKAFSSTKSLSAGQILQAALSETYYKAKVELTAEVRNQIEELTRYFDVPVPEDITVTLRPYQLRGYSWMYRNMMIGFGSIIADDMGLGKTLQVIALLQKVKNDGMMLKKKAIVIVPTGLLSNWQSEIERFTSNLSYFVYHGAQRNLKDFHADILLTTYGVLRSDIETLKKKKWQIAVIDEAQNIKNANTSQSKAVRSLPAETRIAMSGTPVENRLSEFWSVMDFANKGYFGTIKAFQDDYADPIQSQGDKYVLENFRKITAPFMMRRLKTDKTIINDLPDKIEQDETVYLSEVQVSLYEETLNEALKEIRNVAGVDSKSLFKRKGLILQMILALKQICNHPALFLKNNNCKPEDSGKVLVLLDLLKSIVDGGQKVLIFTQFKEMGDMLEKMIFDAIGKRPLFLHGGCSVKERKAMVERFQSNKNDQIFILSLKAAGTGLNLTAASHVIHYDLWWNPAVEAQATDRAYRIGQHQNVLVHRFIVKNTFEERINEMIQKKKELADMTIATGENWIGNLSNEELKEIFERE